MTILPYLNLSVSVHCFNESIKPFLDLRCSCWQCWYVHFFFDVSQKTKLEEILEASSTVTFRPSTTYPSIWYWFKSSVLTHKLTLMDGSAPSTFTMELCKPESYLGISHSVSSLYPKVVKKIDCLMWYSNKQNALLFKCKLLHNLHGWL